MPPDAQPTPRLLIVDDEPGTIRVLGQILHDFGEIFFATHGEEALALVRQHQPDIILLDAEMPNMSGFEVCETIKRDPIFADLPILFVTADDSMESETRALGLGAVDFISKPLSPPIVRARVRTHLTLKQRNDLLRNLASVDGLTGIANRRSFDTTLEDEWRRACRSKAPLSLALIDVDHFKRYNDHYGHQAGDDCLRAVARTVADCVKRPGELAARYGGEEFAIILPSCDLAAAQALAERVCAMVAARNLPHHASDTAAHVTVSIGVSTLKLHCMGTEPHRPSWSGHCPESEACHAEIAALITAADEALYRAKAEGRNRVRPADSAAELIT